MVKLKTTVAFQGDGRTRSSGVAQWKPYTLSFVNQEKLSFSVSHPGWHDLGSKGYDVGGPVMIEKTLFSPTVGIIHDFNMEGPWCPNPGTVPTPTIPTTSSLNASGATGIARSTPTTPYVNMAVSMAELAREGIPRYIGSNVFKAKVRHAKSAGDEFLNYEFGWLPLVSDLRKFCYAVKNHNKIIKSYVKNSGHKLRRSYEFPGSTTSGTSTGITNGTPLTNATYQMMWTKTDSIHFSGAFRYHVPLSSEGASRLSEFESKANHLLGLRLTPEVVWNLTPWSWAADWFGNVGDIMHNISTLGHDGLALQYGYISSKSEVVKSVSSKLTAHGVTYTSGCQSRSSFYTRLGASPFGFGISPAGLSLTQKAVVAALGLSKGGSWLP